MSDFYYRVSVESNPGFLKAARTCMGCREIVDYVGGGDSFLCASCHQLLASGWLKEQFKAKKTVARLGEQQCQK
ncbi:zinc finger domain-containing protein [Endozoicomonas lisbonensis]|uniref:LSD1 subclass zinc finger protein n=1 Tax=Endozoicomonas lisbonensis TaxID=3120522 RepID=A0ABV2SRM8_9GAMM